jgi:type II secretory pathway pseudopilin PulG
MNPETNTNSRAKDFFLNLGATISLYTVVASLINLLFTVINKAYPQVSAYYYASSPSISFPVAVLVIATPILILLMWLLEKSYNAEPEKKDSSIHRWLAYITLFLSGAIVAGDLVTVLYYFINGNELSAAFLLKVLALIVVSGCIFGYYLTDIRGKLTPSKRKTWRIVSVAIILISIVIGFAVLGSPRTQRRHRYDEQKVADLQNINTAVQNYYRSTASIPGSLSDLSPQYYSPLPTDPQSGESYEYQLIGQSAKAYRLCATFNFASDANDPSLAYPYETISWKHPAGRYCFDLAIPLDQYVTPKGI